MSFSRCKSCGKQIEWIEIIEKEMIKRIPLDPRAPTYEFDGLKWRRSSAHVSHFSTCPNANDFSKSKQKKESQNVDTTTTRWYERD